MAYLLNDADTIPSILWQTYKTAVIPNSAKSLIKSWLAQNPNLEWYFMDDLRCDQFIQDHFSDEFYNMYQALPFGVMRADVWRVAVVYVYGGIYADTDCDCLVPVSTWINSTDRLIVAVEVSNGALANFVFAAAPKHPALLNVLDKFVELYQSLNFLDTNVETPVQNFGQLGFSAGILEYYGVHYHSSEMFQGGTTNFYNEIPLVNQERTKFILQQDNRITNGYTQTSWVTHLVASENWLGSDYNSWRTEQKRLLKK